MESKVSGGGGNEWRSFNLAFYENSTKVYSTHQRLKIAAVLPKVGFLKSISTYFPISFD
jgi:hypothetical protein